MAKTLEVKMMNWSWVMPKTAGMLSTAKMRSLTSMQMRTMKRGVKWVRPF